MLGRLLKRPVRTRRQKIAMWWRRYMVTVKVMTTMILAGLLSTCSPHVNLLARIRLEGVLHVATTNSPTTCYQGSSGPAGFECELLQKLADSLGVRLQLHYYGNTPAVMLAVIHRHADIGAAGLVVNDIEAQRVHFTMPLRKVTQQLVYHLGDPHPKSLDDLHGEMIVVDDSAAAVALTQHLQANPDLRWQTTSKLGSEDLLYQVGQGSLTYTVANSDLVAINKRYYPDLNPAFDISDPQPIAWALRDTPDESLYNIVQKFLGNIGEKGLAHLHDQYFNSSDNLDYLGVVRFSADCNSLLPKYRDTFEKAAKQNDLDWRLLASIGYQESHWDPTAVSYTGVRGLMMLTNDTAAQMNVANRENPHESIQGAAKYFASLLQRLPDSIKQPDRTWMALAAYNMGLGHLLDARVLAQKRGGDPGKWKDVDKALPLLMQEHWFEQTRYGYARGAEAQAFVANVRSYYDILIWFTGGQPQVIERGTAKTREAISKAGAS